MVYVAREAAEKLAKEGISVEIVDLRTVLPIDEETILASVKKTSKAILLHEDILTGGIGGEIAARIAERAFEYLDGPVVRIAVGGYARPLQPAPRGRLPAQLCRRSSRRLAGCTATELIYCQPPPSAL